MGKLRILFRVMVILGFVSFIAGIFMSMKELMEYGLCVGVAGIVGYAIIFVVGSTSIARKKTISD